MELDYLPSDKVFRDEHPTEGDKHRWLFYWQHAGVMDQVWRFGVDYTKVSDSSYFNDFSSKYGSSTDGYATQKFSVGYAVQNFDATVSTKQFRYSLTCPRLPMVQSRSWTLTGIRIM